jgi:hypothetical protein
MTTPIERISASKKDYAYTTFTPDIEDECFICKEPYGSKDACHPIRITAYGHPISLACFQECTRRTPGKCSYGGHELPGIKLEQERDSVETVPA